MKNNIFKTVSVMMIFNLVSKVLGFLRDYFTAIKLGTSMEADAYLMASNIPNVLFVIIGVAITTTLIPVYNDIKCNKRKAELKIFISNIITIFIILSVGITILCEIFSPELVSIMAPGFDGDKYNLTVILTRILASVIILNTLIYIFNAVLQCENNFALPASIGIPYNITLIIYFIFFVDKYGVIGISVVVSIGLLVQIAFLIVGLKKIGFKYKFHINIYDENLKKMLILLIPVCIGTGMTQINGIFNGIFASSLDGGSVAAINYALKLYILIVDIVIISITTIVYQNITKLAVTKQYNKIAQEVNRSVILMFIILVPIVIIAFLYCTQIVTFLFQRGAFDTKSTEMTSQAFYYYSLGLFSIAINNILSRVCYALEDTKTPMINTIFGIIINIATGFILKDIMGVGGIALASSIGSMISVCILYVNVRKKISNCITIATVKTIGKLFVGCIPMSLIIVYFKNYVIDLNTQNALLEIIKMGASVFIGIAIYIGICILSRVEELDGIHNIIKSKINKS